MDSSERDDRKWCDSKRYRWPTHWATTSSEDEERGRRFGLGDKRNESIISVEISVYIYRIS